MEEIIENLIRALTLLPSIGEKTSERLAFAILKMSEDKTTEIIKAIKEAKKNIKQCLICGIYTKNKNDKCNICLNKKRDKTKIMILSFPQDVYIFENNKTLNYNGTYYVLNGIIDSNTNVKELNINGLIERIINYNVKEIIIAFEPTQYGDLTTKYLIQEIKNNIKNIQNISITRLAYGLPVGGSLEFTNDFTISEAFKGRKKIEC